MDTINVNVSKSNTNIVLQWTGDSCEKFFAELNRNKSRVNASCTDDGSSGTISFANLTPGELYVVVLYNASTQVWNSSIRTCKYPVIHSEHGVNATRHYLSISHPLPLHPVSIHPILFLTNIIWTTEVSGCLFLFFQIEVLNLFLFFFIIITCIFGEIPVRHTRGMNKHLFNCSKTSWLIQFNWIELLRVHRSPKWEKMKEYLRWGFGKRLGERSEERKDRHGTYWQD